MTDNPNPIESIKLEGYDEASCIGIGGMATVWRAKQRSLDRWVAIKILSPELCTEAEDVERFQSEARVIAKMNHINIVQVYDAFFYDNQFCFIMEFIDGYTVGDLLQNRGYLPQDDCLNFAAGVAQALCYAWNRQQIIHCDIKPENIMINDVGVIKVTDFGLSRSLSAIPSQLDGESDEYVFGTPAYISPEQARGVKDLTIHADMYSLGATLFHMCTGKRLFSTSNSDQVMANQVYAQDQDPILLNTLLTPFYCDFIEKLLCKAPEDRYNSWEEVIADIERIQRGLPLATGVINPAHTTSTIQCSPERIAARDAILEKLQPQPKKSQKRLKIDRSTSMALQEMRDGKRCRKRIPIIPIVLVIILVCAGAVYLTRHLENQKQAQIQKAAEQELNDIKSSIEAEPNSYSVAIRKCEELIQALDPEKQGEIRQHTTAYYRYLTDEQSKQVDHVMNTLRREARVFTKMRDFEGAQMHLLNYKGPFAEETLSERTTIANGYQFQANRQRKQRTDVNAQ